MTRASKCKTLDKAEAKRVELPEEREINLLPRDYQPTKAEKEEAFEMPGADVETARSAFFRPIRSADR